MKRLCAGLATLTLLAACSARIDSPAVDGRIEDYRHADGLQRSLRISWTCSTESPLSRLFSPSGSSTCSDGEGRGEVTLPISRTGSFEIPALDVRVTKFFSRPSLNFRWEIVTADVSGNEDVELLTGGTTRNDGFFRDVLADYRSLRHLAFEDACVQAEIKAVDGRRQLSFDDIRQVYPESYNFGRIYYLSATLRRNGRVVASRNFSLAYDQSRFCATGLGFFIPAGEARSGEILSYTARIEISAGVVYARAPMDPVTGQRARDGRHVREVIVRKAEAPAEAMNRLPQALLEPITVTLDITRPPSSA